MIAVILMPDSDPPPKTAAAEAQVKSPAEAAKSKFEWKSELAVIGIGRLERATVNNDPARRAKRGKIRSRRRLGLEDLQTLKSAVDSYAATASHAVYEILRMRAQQGAVADMAVRAAQQYFDTGYYATGPEIPVARSHLAAVENVAAQFFAQYLTARVACPGCKL